MPSEENKQNPADLDKEILRLINKLYRLTKLPPAKRPSTAINRAFKAVSIAIEIARIKNKRHPVIFQPKPNFPPGGIK